MPVIPALRKLRTYLASARLLLQTPVPKKKKVQDHPGHRERPCLKRKETRVKKKKM
jgi:hypothetical protein